jgi:predicted kinase
MLAVIVNGLPGSGKSTLAPRLASLLRLPLFGKDSIKETMADMLGVTPPDDRTAIEWNHTLGAAASETIWTLLGQSTIGAVIEQPFLANVRHFVEAGLARSGADEVHEVWCELPAETARERYAARTAIRHPIHNDRRDTTAEWAYWLTIAEPLGIGTLHRVDTRTPVSDAALASLAAAISSAGRPGREADLH